MSALKLECDLQGKDKVPMEKGESIRVSSKIKNKIKKAMKKAIKRLIELQKNLNHQ